MKILFEEYAYDKDDVMAFVPKHYLQSLKNNKVCVPYVGYFYSREVDDSVFILPKVFIKIYDKKSYSKNEKIEKAFGRFDPKNLIDTNNKDNPILGTQFYTHIYDLSVWIYRAIERYREREPLENNTERVEVLCVDSVNGNKSQTLINSVLDLVRFNKEHQSLFTFVAKLSTQGHNRISWQKTISKCSPYIQDAVPIYLKSITKTKIFNPDEELIVLFFSVMDYLHEKYHFHIVRNLNYSTFPREVVKMIETGKGSRYLRKIRHKYFKDELVKLWNLLYVFFKRAEDMKSNKITEDYLLVKVFDRVFEDMIDTLISDDTKIKDKKMVDQRDRKIVDHIYKYESLVRKDDIYYIGDSKYYKEGSNPGDEAVYKQFTYARNVIQRNMDLLKPKANKLYRDNYFDPLTEGYNVTPNFFIRGTVEDEDYSFGFRLEATKLNGKHDVERMWHHKNRLFDRDSLLVLKYNISFLYVLSSYASSRTDENIRRKIRGTFRTHVMSQLDQDYRFFKLRVFDGVEKNAAIDKHFKLLIGKIFSTFDGRDEKAVLMALERNTCDEVIKEIYQKVKNEFEIIDYDLINDKEGVVYREPIMVHVPNAVQGEFQFEEDELEEEFVFDYEILDDVEDEEKFVNFLPVFTIKAACGYNDDFEIANNRGYPIPDGWVRVAGLGFKISDRYFVVEAKGNSMYPDIKNGQLCVFSWYSTNGVGGSREGETVLTRCREYYDPDYGGRFTIKKYHSEWEDDEDGIRQHSIIELIPSNDSYDKIVLSEDYQADTIGIFKCVL